MNPYLDGAGDGEASVVKMRVSGPEVDLRTGRIFFPLSIIIFVNKYPVSCTAIIYTREV